MHKNLRSFLDLLRKEDEIVEVNAEVDPYLEIAEVHRRVIEQNGKALLFRNVKGSEFPLVTNLFGTNKRIDLAFGKKPQEFVRRAVKFAESIIPPRLSTLWSYRDIGRTGLKLGTKRVRNAPVLEARQSEVDLGKIPLIQLWHEDGGFFFTLPLVYTESPGEQQTEPRYLPDAALRRADDRHALADRKGRRVSLFRSRAKRTGLAWSPCS